MITSTLNSPLSLPVQTGYIVPLLQLNKLTLVTEMKRLLVSKWPIRNSCLSVSRPFNIQFNTSKFYKSSHFTDFVMPSWSGL